jgi:hypothetical protein
MVILFPSVGREFYSTPLVFLTDTFTGKFLCGRDVGRGHLFGNEISQLHSRLTSIRRNNIHPHIGIDIVLQDTLTLGNITFTSVPCWKGLEL